MNVHSTSAPYNSAPPAPSGNRSRVDRVLAAMRQALIILRYRFRKRVIGTGKTWADARRHNYGTHIVHDPSSECRIDIIFIHGLNGDAFDTWTFKNEEREVFWPWHLLPEHFQSARVITYGYDGATEGMRPLSHQSIHDIAETFVARLSHFRQDSATSKRPIVFIAHSVGGIILKHALVTSFMASKDHNWDHRYIHDSTRGIVFLGTPHQGTDAAPWQTVLPSIYSLSANPNRRELKDLQRDSASLQDLTSKFTAISMCYWIKYVYETHASKLRGGGSAVIVPKGCAVLSHQNAEAFGRCTDHLGLAKFESADDDGFMDIVSILRAMPEAKPREGPQVTNTMILRASNETRCNSKITTLSDEPSRSRFMSNATLYTWHLLQKQLGYPMWYPAPCNDAPDEYRRCGVQIGDVGCLVNGAFDYHFNVCRPANDLVNLGRVPSDFIPFPGVFKNIREQSEQHPIPSHYLSSDEMWCGGCMVDGTTTPHELTLDGYHYKSTGEEGALLVLPAGADCQDLRTLKKMGEYAQQYSHLWFAHLDQRGIQVRDLCLVTGCDKTSSWGVASFRSLSQAHTSFRFLSSKDSSGDTCRWKHCPPVVAKASQRNLQHNQCVFLRGFNISRQQNQSDALDLQIKLLDGTSREGYYRDLTFDPKPDNTQLGNSTESKPCPVAMHQNETSQATQKDPQMLEADNIAITDIALQPEVLHPGHILNRRIMEVMGPEAKTVTTHDNDWCSLRPAGLCDLMSYSGDGAIETSALLKQSDLNLQINNIIDRQRLLARGDDDSHPRPQNAGVNAGTKAADKDFNSLGSLRTIHEPEGNKADVDIVVIHGSENPADPWAEDDVNEISSTWLRDFVPPQTHAARILAYAYDAETHERSQLSHQSLAEHGRKFAVKLMFLRQATCSTERPLIFIAHGVGGDILKFALLEAFRSHEGHLVELKDLKLSTCAIAFLDKHHGPSPPVVLGKGEINRIWTLLSNGNGTTSDTTLLNDDSYYLEDIMTMFPQLLDENADLLRVEE